MNDKYKNFAETIFSTDELEDRAASCLEDGDKETALIYVKRLRFLEENPELIDNEKYHKWLAEQILEEEEYVCREEKEELDNLTTSIDDFMATNPSVEEIKKFWGIDKEE